MNLPADPLVAVILPHSAWAALLLAAIGDATDAIGESWKDGDDSREMCKLIQTLLQAVRVPGRVLDAEDRAEIEGMVERLFAEAGHDVQRYERIIPSLVKAL